MYVFRAKNPEFVVFIIELILSELYIGKQGSKIHPVIPAGGSLVLLIYDCVSRSGEFK